MNRRLFQDVLGLTVACARCHDTSSMRFRRGLLRPLRLLESGSYRPPALRRRRPQPQGRGSAGCAARAVGAGGSGGRRLRRCGPGRARRRLSPRWACGSCRRAGRGGLPRAGVDGGAAGGLGACAGSRGEGRPHPFTPGPRSPTPAILTPAAALRDEWAKRAARAESATAGAAVVVDYAHPRPGDWLPDDVTYASGRPAPATSASAPTRPGRSSRSSRPGPRVRPGLGRVDPTPRTEHETGDRLDVPAAGPGSRSQIVSSPGRNALTGVRVSGPVHEDVRSRTSTCRAA